MATFQGIDVSNYQGNINWNRVKADGKTFAMVRTGYSTTADKRFEANYAGATAADINVGAYHFSYATSVAKARAEAEFVLELLRGKRFPYPIAYDFEEESARYAQSRGVRVTKELATAMAKEFLSTVQGAGYYVMLYSNLNCINLYFDMNELRAYDLWYAQWGSRPTYSGNFGIWQRSSTGRVNGISGNVDLDVAYKDYPTIMRNKGLNGYRRGESPEVEGAIDGSSDDIDIYLLQTDLKALHEKKLLAADCPRNGVFDAATEAAVRALQKKAGLTENGRCNRALADYIYRQLLTL